MFLNLFKRSKKDKMEKLEEEVMQIKLAAYELLRESEYAVQALMSNDELDPKTYKELEVAIEKTRKSLNRTNVAS